MSGRTALVVANASDADPGFVGDRLEQRGFLLHTVLREAGGVPSTVAAAGHPDLVVLLGSEWSVHAPVDPAALDAECELVRSARGARVPVLGLCYGAQVLAHALGGSVRAAPGPEIGLVEVDTSDPELVPAAVRGPHSTSTCWSRHPTRVSSPETPAEFRHSCCPARSGCSSIQRSDPTCWTTGRAGSPSWSSMLACSRRSWCSERETGRRTHDRRPTDWSTPSSPGCDDPGGSAQRAEQVVRRGAALRDHGVADDDLRSSEIEVHPDYGKDGHRAGFRASMGVTAALRDLPRAGEVLGVVLEAGGDASRVHGVTLTATGTDETTAAARDAAWADATARAGQYAALAGRNLGSVLRISELGYPDAAPQVSSARAASLTAQVEPGTQTIRAAVAVRWELV